MSYSSDELLSRPKITDTVMEICYFGNDKVQIEEVINALYKAKKAKDYHKVWVDVDTSEDEWGHHRGTTLVVRGERFLTDDEWKKELKRAFNRHKSEKERFLMQSNYFNSERFDVMQKNLKDKIKEIGGNTNED